MIDGMSPICKMIQQLNDDLLQFYTPAVRDICNQEHITESELEYLLDSLVSACISNDMILLFKKCVEDFTKNIRKQLQYIL